MDRQRTNPLLEMRCRIEKVGRCGKKRKKSENELSANNHHNTFLKKEKEVGSVFVMVTNSRWWRENHEPQIDGIVVSARHNKPTRGACSKGFPSPPFKNKKKEREREKGKERKWKSGKGKGSQNPSKQKQRPRTESYFLARLCLRQCCNASLALKLYQSAIGSWVRWRYILTATQELLLLHICQIVHPSTQPSPQRSRVWAWQFWKFYVAT